MDGCNGRLALPFFIFKKSFFSDLHHSSAGIAKKDFFLTTFDDTMICMHVCMYEESSEREGDKAVFRLANLFGSFDVMRGGTFLICRTGHNRYFVPPTNQPIILL